MINKKNYFYHHKFKVKMFFNKKIKNYKANLLLNQVVINYIKKFLERTREYFKDKIPVLNLLLKFHS